MSLPAKVAAAIDKARAAYLESTRKAVRPGPDWFSASEYASHEGLMRSAASLRLRKMRKVGVIESRRDGKNVWWRVKP